MISLLMVPLRAGKKRQHKVRVQRQGPGKSCRAHEVDTEKLLSLRRGIRTE